MNDIHTDKEQKPMNLRRIALVAGVTLASLVLALAFTQPATSDPDFEWQELGQTVFTANCASCHGAAGTGIPGAFPPLAGHVPSLLSVEGGHELLVNTILYGLVGPIDVNGVHFQSAMPPWAHLGDAELAAVLNHVAVSWGNADLLAEGTTLFAPADIAAERGKGITGLDVHAIRTAVLGLATTTDDASESGDSGADDVVLLNDDTGYFTAAQAARGLEVYRESCSSCHGQTLRGGLHGPALTNLAFFRTWGDRSFDSLFTFLSTQMPINNPGGLRSDQYLDLAAYWLEFNNYPAGDIPLTRDPQVLGNIPIERR